VGRLEKDLIGFDECPGVVTEGRGSVTLRGALMQMMVVTTRKAGPIGGGCGFSGECCAGGRGFWIALAGHQVTGDKAAWEEKTRTVLTRGFGEVGRRRGRARLRGNGGARAVAERG
jgi:hypothetical protein